MDFTIFALGWRLITRPGLKRFVILPLLANIIILGKCLLVVMARLVKWSIG